MPLTLAHKDQSNVVRGLKAAIHNPRVSEEAKQRDIERLQAMGEYEADTTTQEDSEHHHRVMGGYKATLSSGSSKYRVFDGILTGLVLCRS